MKITVKSVSTAEVFEKVSTENYMNYLKSISEKYLICNVNKYSDDFIDVYVLDGEVR